MGESKKFSRFILNSPIAVEDLGLYAIDKARIKNWRDFPHKRYEWLLTDDNWVVCVTWVFDDGSCSLMGKLILTPKKAKEGRALRLFTYTKDRFRFNNHAKIMANSAMLTGDWDLAHRLSYGYPPKSIKDLMFKINAGVEEYLVKQLDTLLEQHGITDSFLLDNIKGMANGFLTYTGSDSKTKQIPISDNVRWDILKTLMSVKHDEMATKGIPAKVSQTYNDNRTFNYEETLKELKEPAKQIK